MKYVKILFSLLLILSIIAGAIGCSAEPGEKRPSGGNVAQAVDLMGDVRAGRVNGRVADTAFIESMADFSIELFKNSISTTENKNSLISPLSVMTTALLHYFFFAIIDNTANLPIFMGTLLTV